MKQVTVIPSLNKFTENRNKSKLSKGLSRKTYSYAAILTSSVTAFKNENYQHYMCGCCGKKQPFSPIVSRYNHWGHIFNVQLKLCLLAAYLFQKCLPENTHMSITFRTCTRETFHNRKFITRRNFAFSKKKLLLKDISLKTAILYGRYFPHNLHQCETFGNL